MIKSKPSIHVIKRGGFSSNGNFIGRDDDFNTIFIPQSVMKSSRFSSLDNIQFPFYSIAFVETYNKLDGKPGDKQRNVVKTANGKIVQFKRLTSRFVSPNIDNLLRVYTETISINAELIEIEFQPKDIIENLEYLQNSLIRYATSLKKILYEKDNSLFTQLVESRRHNLENGIEIIAPGFACADIWHKLINWGFNLKTISRDEWFESSNIDDYSTIKNHLVITELHLYTEHSKSRVDTNIKRRIIKLDDFKQIKIGQEWRYYLTQYYHLKPNPILDKEEDKYLESFERERFYDFRERCKNEFNEYKLYTIRPVLNEEASSVEISKIHNEVILLVENLNSINIFNIIILPPANDLSYRLQMKDEANDYEGNDYILYEDIADEEIRRMDDETDGFWRIANDLD